MCDWVIQWWSGKLRVSSRNVPSLDVVYDSLLASSIKHTVLTNSGAGPIGLVTALAAHAAGCTPIVITDLIQSRLDFAISLLPGIKTVCIPRGASPEDVAEMIKDKAGGQVKVALECTGFESSIRAAIYVSFGCGAAIGENSCRVF